MVFNFNFNLIVTQVDGVKVGAYLSLIGRGRGGVDAYSRLGANSRLGDYPNKYGNFFDIELSKIWFPSCIHIIFSSLV